MLNQWVERCFIDTFWTRTLSTYKTCKPKSTIFSLFGKHQQIKCKIYTYNGISPLHLTCDFEPKSDFSSWVNWELSLNKMSTKCCMNSVVSSSSWFSRLVFDFMNCIECSEFEKSSCFNSMEQSLVLWTCKSFSLTEFDTIVSTISQIS